MLATFLRFELTNLMRDEMTRVMLLYPIVLGGLVRLLIGRGMLGWDIAEVAAALVVLAAVELSAEQRRRLADTEGLDSVRPARRSAGTRVRARRAPRRQ